MTATSKHAQVENTTTRLAAIDWEILCLQEFFRVWVSWCLLDCVWLSPAVPQVPAECCRCSGPDHRTLLRAALRYAAAWRWTRCRVPVPMVARAGPHGAAVPGLSRPRLGAPGPA